MTEPYEFLDVSEEEAKKALEQIKNAGNRDGRICICGHSIKFHGFIEARGTYMCNAQKNSCPCKQPRPVINTDNARLFVRKTYGGGGFHALTQGITAAIEAGSHVEWIVEQKCDICRKEARLSPTPMTRDGRPSFVEGATGLDALLCIDCRSGNAGSSAGLRAVE